ncbi:MAG: hypothetical protein ACLTG0_06085 [Oscillibacter sp.]
MKPVYFFLGANSEEGFFSLYDQLLGGRLDDLMILKGGPGCGKSTFMRRVGAAMERAGERIVYINCSGDPDSLDGAIFLDRNAAIVDGTSPHVLEPTYAVASERYVDLTRFYDVDAAKARRAEIVALSDEYRAHYRSAYRILRAMGEVESERRVAMHAQMDFSKLRRRTDGILARELRGEGGGSGRVDRAFLGSVTHRGEICRFDTVEALCPRIYAIIDSAGLGNEMLETVVQAAQAKHFRHHRLPESRPAAGTPSYIDPGKRAGVYHNERAQPVRREVLPPPASRCDGRGEAHARAEGEAALHPPRGGVALRRGSERAVGRQEGARRAGIRISSLRGFRGGHCACRERN